MSRLRARIEHLEQAIPPHGVINWDNLYRRREEMVPDGIVDWEASFAPAKPWSAEECPIEQAIAAAGRRSLDPAGSAPAKVAPAAAPLENSGHRG